VSIHGTATPLGIRLRNPLAWFDRPVEVLSEQCL
jgi:hypothetical protein